MATKVRLTSGYIALRSDSQEQAQSWSEITKNVSPVGNHPIYTPDGYKYFIESETEVLYNKYEAVIKANNKTIKLKYNICNANKKTMEAVRNLYK